MRASLRRAVLVDLLRAQLRRHPGRAVTLALTLALAVTLLASAFVLAASLRTAIDQGLAVSWEGADVVVRTQLATAEGELAGSGGSGTVSYAPAQVADLGRLDGVAAATA